MQLKFQQYQPNRRSLQESLYRMDAKYDRQPMTSKDKIARSILVPTADSLSIANTYKNYDKSFIGDDKSRVNKSKISCSLGRKPSKHKNKEKEEEISYYKILYENLQNQNQRLKYHINKSKTRKSSKVKVNKQPITNNQIEHLVNQIQSIQKRFEQDKQKPLKYLGFYKKFISEFQDLGLKTPKTTEQAWEGWLIARKKIESIGNSI